MDNIVKVNVLNKTNEEKPVEVVLREGEATKQLDPKAPVKINIVGTINAPVEFLNKRIDAEQFYQGDCHVLVNRDNITIELVVNESDAYKRGTVKGALQFNPKFTEFGINANKVWAPTELGMFFKMNRAFFTDRSNNMKLASALMNFTATVNNSIERSVKENGDRTDNFAQVVNSNLPDSFTLNIPIFKGMPAEQVEVETFAQVNGREVAFALLSPGAQATLEEMRDKVIDEQVAAIREIAPNIAIFEV